MSDTPKRQGTREAIGYAVATAAVVAVLSWPAVVVAVAALRTVARGLRRVDYVIIGSVGFLIWALYAPSATPAWFAWLGGLVGVGDRHWLPPFVPLLALSLGYVGVFGFVSSLAVADRVAANVGGWRGALRKAVRPNPLARPSLIPDARERAKAKVAPAPGGVVGITADVHAVDGDQRPGERSFAIGFDRRRAPVYLSEQEIGMHGLILGSTGSGKTETIKALAAALMDLGWPGMILDLKEDTSTGGLRDFLAAYCSSHAVVFQELALSDPNPAFWFNPLAGMGPDEARDTILSLNEFDDAYWQNINKKMLGQIVNLFFDAHAVDPTQCPYPTMYDIGKALGSGNLNQATKRMRALVLSQVPARCEDDFAALATPSADEAKSATGFGAKLTQMYDTAAGRTVLRPGGDRPMMDVTQAGLTYIGLDTQGKADLSRVVSSAVLQRMSVYAAQRTTGVVKKSQPRFLIVDEANWVDRQIVKNLLSRARSAGIVVFLCTQGPEDWIDRRGDDWSVMAQNMNVAVIMSQGSPRAAELCAELIGRRETVSLTAQLRRGEVVADAGQARQEVDYLVRPDELRRMSIGEAILRVNKPAERVTWMQVRQRDPHARPPARR